MTEPNRPRRILLATDLSARSDRALDRAATLAESWQAELIAVHALEQTDDFYANDLERRLPFWRKSPDAARIVVEQLRHDMMLQTTAKIHAMVEKGRPADVIVRAATTQGCDLIVTGIARDETLGRFWLGSTVDELLRRTRVPLLLVKQRARTSYRNIIVAVDFSDSSRHALRTAMAFFPDEKLGVFHASGAPMPLGVTDPARYQEDCRTLAAREGADFLANAGLMDRQRNNLELLVEYGRPAQLIGQYVRDRGVDLVVLATHGRSALFEIFLGSTAKDILSSLPCDVLVVREPRSAVEGEARV